MIFLYYMTLDLQNRFLRYFGVNGGILLVANQLSLFGKIVTSQSCLLLRNLSRVMRPQLQIDLVDK